jgi:glyoxylase-like metal-dependent hydrolase (beta-lactamase superfamily II)
MRITTTVDEVTPDLVRLRYLFANLYLYGSPEKWTLIDGGVQGCGGALLDTVDERFGGGPPHSIVLTHGHFDHVGAFPEVFERWGADIPIYAHRLELPHITGERDYLPPDPSVGRGVMALLSFTYPNKAADLGPTVRALPDDGSVPNMPGWRWLHTPGHTDGHVSLFRESDRCLIAGDAFVTVQQESLYDVARQEEEVHGPPSYFTPDWISARASVEQLAALNPEIAATGHGTPMRGGDLRHGLEHLVRTFDETAIPNSGRYVPEQEQRAETP